MILRTTCRWPESHPWGGPFAHHPLTSHSQKETGDVIVCSRMFTVFEIVDSFMMW